MGHSSGSYLLRKTFFALGTIAVAVVFNFAIFRLAPGNAADMSRVPTANPQEKAALRHEFGMDKPLYEQFVIYVGALARGDLGVSFQTRAPVTHDLMTAVANTVPLAGSGTLLAVLMGLATGIVSAYRRGTAIDRGSLAAALVIYSLPAQWLGLMLLILFGGWFPAGGMTDEFLLNPTPMAHFQDFVSHLALPSATLALTLYGQYAIVVRSSLLETFGEDYVLTARAKGLTSWQTLRRHALRNALLPVSTLIALSLGFIVAGAVLVETVFSWPGIGRAMYEAVLARDYPMLQGGFLLLTFSVVLCNYLADLLYLKLDPRISSS